MFFLCSQPDDIVFFNQLHHDRFESQKIQPVKFSDSALVVLRQRLAGQLRPACRNGENIMLESDGKEVNEQAVAVALGQKENATATEIIGGFNFNMPLRELREEVERRYFEYHIAQEGQNMSRVAQRSVWSVHTFTANSNNSVSAYQPQRRQIRRISAISVQTKRPSESHQVFQTASSFDGVFRQAILYKK